MISDDIVLQRATLDVCIVPHVPADGTEPPFIWNLTNVDTTIIAMRPVGVTRIRWGLAGIVYRCGQWLVKRANRLMRGSLFHDASNDCA